MARCPFAVWRPLPENSSQPRIAPRAVILHTAWSNASSLYGFFRYSSNLESHFYVNDQGTIEQYMDTTVRADANYRANDFAVSIETWDGRTIRPWNPAQVEALVRLVNWICTTHGVPRRQIPAWDSSGIGWHVQFGAPGPWTPVAKSCPGAPRIDQTKNVIIPRVAGGGAGGGGGQMALDINDKAYIRARTVDVVRYLSDGDAANQWTGQTILKVRQDLNALGAKVDALGTAPVPEIDYDQLAAALQPHLAAAFADELARRLEE